MSQERIGSFNWLQKTRGKMTLASRLTLLRQVLAPALTGAARSALQHGANARLDIQTIPLPDSAAVRHALDELEDCASNGIIQHSFRTYFWGAGFGQTGKLAYDPEFLLVGCLLHDLGMTDRYNGHSATCSCFAGDSALAARTLMHQAGWNEERAESLADMICLHMNGHVPLEDGIEAHLLQQGAACDVVGSRYYDFHADYRAAVLQQHPRDGFNRTMNAFIRKEMIQRPASRAALMYMAGLPLMIKMNPFSE